jgi:hypothetical protein
VGPGCQGHPLPPADGSDAPSFMAAGRYRPVFLFPRLQNLAIKPPFTSPPSLGRFPSLNPPLESPSRPHGHWWPWPPGAASPPLPGLHKRP